MAVIVAPVSTLMLTFFPFSFPATVISLSSPTCNSMRV